MGSAGKVLLYGGNYAITRATHGLGEPLHATTVADCLHFSEASLQRAVADELLWPQMLERLLSRYKPVTMLQKVS